MSQQPFSNVICWHIISLLCTQFSHCHLLAASGGGRMRGQIVFLYCGGGAGRGVASPLHVKEGAGCAWWCPPTRCHAPPLSKRNSYQDVGCCLHRRFMGSLCTLSLFWTLLSQEKRRRIHAVLSIRLSVHFPATQTRGEPEATANVGTRKAFYMLQQKARETKPTMLQHFMEIPFFD